MMEMGETPITKEYETREQRPIARVYTNLCPWNRSGIEETNPLGKDREGGGGDTITAIEFMKVEARERVDCGMKTPDFAGEVIKRKKTRRD